MVGTPEREAGGAEERDEDAHRETRPPARFALEDAPAAPGLLAGALRDGMAPIPAVEQAIDEGLKARKATVSAGFRG